MESYGCGRGFGSRLLCRIFEFLGTDLDKSKVGEGGLIGWWGLDLMWWSCLADSEIMRAFRTP